MTKYPTGREVFKAWAATILNTVVAGLILIMVAYIVSAILVTTGVYP